MKKNVASQVIGAQLINATTGAAFTGSVTVYVTGDGGTQATGTVGSGAATHEGNGFHTYAPSQAETNYDHIGFTFTGSGAVPATVQVYTSFPQTGDSYGRLGAPTGASIAADIGTVDTVADGIKAVTDNLPNSGALSSLATAAALATVDGNVDSILEDTGTTLPATLSTIAGYVDTEVAAIKAVTDALPDSGALTSLATAAALATVDTNVDAILADTGTSGVIVSEITASALADLFNTDSGTTYASAVSGSVVAEIADNAGGASLTVGDIADAVWDEALSGHTTAGTAGKAVADIEADATAILADTGTDGVTVAELKATALADLFNTNSGTTYASAVSGSVVSEIADNAGGSSLTAGDIADAVWDEALSGHTTAGTAGKSLADIETDAAAILVDTGTTLPASIATVDGNVDAILVDTGTTLPALIGTPAGATVSADIAAIKSETASILADTGTDGVVVASLGTTAKAHVNAEVVDALSTDTYAEPASVPASTASLAAKVGWLFTLSRNKITQTSTTQTLRNDADGADIGASTVSDDGTTFTRGEYS